jgi:hypothetical protein
MGQVTLFAGGCCRFDGRSIEPPIPGGIPSITATGSGAGGTIAAGTYGIAIVFEWYDADGNRYQSAPAVRNVTTTGATSSIAWTVETLASFLGLYTRQFSEDSGLRPPILKEAVEADRQVWEEIFKLTDAFEVQQDRTQRMHSPQVRGFTHLPIRFNPRRTAPAH